MDCQGLRSLSEREEVHREAPARTMDAKVGFCSRSQQGSCLGQLAVAELVRWCTVDQEGRCRPMVDYNLCGTNRCPTCWEEHRTAYRTWKDNRLEELRHFFQAEITDQRRRSAVEVTVLQEERQSLSRVRGGGYLSGRSSWYNGAPMAGRDVRLPGPTRP